MGRQYILDTYSDERLQRVKGRHPILTFNVYCLLSSAYGLSDEQIIKLYELPRNSFFYFRNNHRKVLKEKRQWA